MFKNKTVVVTGGSRGIGRSIATIFARKGANVAIVGLKDLGALHDTEQLLKSSGGKVVAQCGDVANYNFCDFFTNHVVEQCGSVDILINCAGIISRSDWTSINEDDWNRVLDVNLTGAFNMSRCVLPLMIDQRFGRIVNVTSQMAHMVHVAAAPSYEVSKAGLTALTRHLAAKVATFGICVNAIAPGSINTDLPKSMTENQRKLICDKIPMGRLGEPEEVANCVLFLASSESSYVTGSVLHVNGGSYMA